jgi:putative sterol carrier protein
MAKKSTESKKTIAPAVKEDPKKTAIRKALENWIKKLDNPEVADQFDGYNKTMQFNFPDINVSMRLVFNNKKVQLMDGVDPKADMSLTIDSALFMGIADGSQDPMELFMGGKLKPIGDMTDLEKLQIFME